MNVLPRGIDAASFRAAYEAVGHEPRSAGGTARPSISPTVTSYLARTGACRPSRSSMEVSDANAARAPQVQPPQVSR